MSIRVMSLVWSAHFHDVSFLHVGKKKTGEQYQKTIKVLNSNLKSVCLALADHANDEGEGAYPSVDTIAEKTELSEVTVIACLKAMKQETIITYAGRSKWTTCNYTVNKEKLVEMAGWERQKREKVGSKATLLSKVKPLYSGSKAALVKPSKTVLEPHEDDAALQEAIKKVALAQISKAYESEIGALTAFIADELYDAVDTYPSKWILDAIYESAAQNKRGWKYCLSILKRWKAQGNQNDAKPARKTVKTTQPDNLDDVFARARAKALAEMQS